MNSKVIVMNILKPHMIELNRVGTSIATTKWLRARVLHGINEAIIWENSPYKTFARFCKEELAFTPKSIALWIARYAQLSSLCSWRQIEVLCTEFSFSEVTAHLPSSMHSKPGENKFNFKVYQQGLRTNKSIKAYNKRNKVLNPNTLTLHLNEKYMGKLEALLTPHGFTRTSDGRRAGVSEAMARYLDIV